MKNNNPRKRGGPPGRNKSGNSKFSMDRDPFFSNNKRRKKDKDEEIESEEEEVDRGMLNGGGGSGDDEEDEELIPEETAEEKRQRIAKAVVENLRAREKELEGEEDEEGDREFEKDGERDSFVAKKLMQQQLEESGRLRRVIASRVQKPESVDGFEVLVKHRAIYSGKAEKYQWPNDEILRSHGAKNPEGRATKHSRNVLALAVSTDGRYLASGGLDRHVHLWDTRTREHIQVDVG
ncbi:U3 SMALL NUCLEOLAR RNA INTERACTING PROTEIN 2 [Salix koriyanagi]|uniref:U3 SMALL NUCLEOLAR RNA INTERACTING PROTEIN 2 n=1 Tax=Salix koriyanagi TaxID=2511006 RepID=A0A9Q0P738_9ROSI|nr:U3 SMALL NUCLEOLAR RNA INTERACTING PROTEIN 2 [Salix koriyanagi]